MKLPLDSDRIPELFARALDREKIQSIYASLTENQKHEISSIDREIAEYDETSTVPGDFADEYDAVLANKKISSNWWWRLSRDYHLKWPRFGIERSQLCPSTRVVGMGA